MNPLRSLRALLLLGTGLGLGSACGGSAETPSTPPPAPLPAAGGAPSAPAAQRGKPAPASLTEPQPYDSQELGALHGTILFRGEAPERFPLGASASAECQHHPEVDQRSNVVVVEDGKLAGVFVTLASGVDRARVPPVSELPVTLGQRGCMYVPRVLGARVGQLVRVTNEDPAAHNVHTRSIRNPEQNKTMGAGQPPLEFRFERAEQPVPFKCDIHPWMGAAVFVEEHPWFAVTDERGAFRIRDVPPGEYVVEALHETLGKVAASVTVVAGSSTGFTLTLGK